MAANVDVLESLGERIKIIEEKVYKKDFCAASQSNTPKLVDSLNSVKQSLSSLATGKERIQALWKRMDELNSNLDPEFANRLTLTENTKADIILAEEEQLNSRAALLEKIKGMADILDSQHTKGAPAIQDKLHPLAIVQLDQKEHADKQSQETKQLLQAYNNIIDQVTLLSQQFVQWDAAMTRYEIAAKVRDRKEY